MHRTMTMDNCTHGSATIALTHTHVESGALVTSTQVAKKKKQRGKKKNKRIFFAKFLRFCHKCNTNRTI